MKEKNEHDPNRYGQLWNQDRIDLALREIEPLKDRIILSGGWAWHFMSPPGHAELKHAHDHKDIDLFVRGPHVAEVVAHLKAAGFTGTWTRYDHLDSPEEFRRYEKHATGNAGQPVRITIDFFVDDHIPTREVNGWQVVEPEHLISLYSRIHSSRTCFAAVAAKALLDRGEDPVGREELLRPTREHSVKTR